MNKMPEKRWTIDAGDGARIYGITDSAKRQNTACVVLVHGLTGHMNSYHMKRGAQLLRQHGFDTIRFNLYDGAERGRQLHECTLQTHAADLNSVLAEKTSLYDTVFVVGHSYGGPTTMIARPQGVAAVSLWDPSFNLPETTGRHLPLVEFNDGFYLDWRVRHVLGKDFVAEARTRYDTDECLALSKSFGRPVQVVHAEDGGRVNESMSWHSAGHEDNERIVINGADHCFYNNDTLGDLVAETARFFKQHSSKAGAVS